MYAYLDGNLTYKSPALLHLAAGGVGYELHISLRTFEKIQHLEAARLYTHLLVREDAWILYGFADEAERTTFRALIGVQGVGAAIARLVLSALSPDELERAVATDDHKTLGRIKGIGPKTAQRMVLELKGKLAPGAALTTGGAVQQTTWRNTVEEDALIALVNLGIARPVAETAVKKVPDAGSLTVEALLKAALRNL